MRPAMPFLLLAASILAMPALIVPALAAGRHSAKAPPAREAAAPAGPKSIGKFGDWQAATHEEGGQPSCYAFTRAASSSPKLPGRGDVVLTVTERQGGRDEVAISAGFAFPSGAEVVMRVGKAKLDFYTAQRSAFLRGDGHAAVEAFAHATEAKAQMPAPRGATVSDRFSLRGFPQAYAAIEKACPAK